MAPTPFEATIMALVPLLTRDNPSNGQDNGPADIEGCTLGTCPLDEGYVTYVPSLAGNALFLAIFSIFLFIHLFLAFRYRTLGFGISFFAGIVLEIIGYVGRIQMHFNPFSRDAFLIYLIC